jgi:hypothetical protein
MLTRIFARLAEFTGWVDISACSSNRAWWSLS